MTCGFYRESEDDLIVIECELRMPGKDLYYPLSLVLDTGASHTVLDLNVLLMAGFDRSLKLNKDVKVQTAGKILDADKVFVDELKLMKRSLSNFEITIFDFLAQEDTLEYDGVLGLDFFKGTRLLIDFEKSELTIH